MSANLKIAAATFVFLAVLLLPALTAPAGAQDTADNRRVCARLDGGASAEAIASSCSAVLATTALSRDVRAVALRSRAIAYREMGDHERAIMDYDAALEIDAEFDWAHRGRGAVLLDRGEPARAIAAFDEGIRVGRLVLARMAPGSEDHAEQRRLMAIGFAGRALASARLGNHRNAASDLRLAIEHDPQDADSMNGLCWSLAISGGDLAEARAACDASLRIRPNDGRTLDSRGMVGLKQGRFQEAWNDYDAAIRTNGPALPTFLYGRGIAALRLGRTEEGRADLARATALNAELPQFYAGYGLTP